MADEVVWLLYFQTVIWMAIVWSPFIAIVAPFLLYTMFKFIRFKLEFLQKKPLKSTNAEDLGNYIMIFLNIGFVVIYVVISIFMSQNLEHSNYNVNASTTAQCGPIDNGDNWEDPLEDISEKNSISEQIYKYVKFYPTMWFILIIAALKFYLKRNTIVVLKEFVKDQTKEYKLTISDLERSIARMKHKIELNKIVEQN